MKAAISSSRKVALALVVSGLLALLITSGASAALCVWRNPDADIKEYFGSGSYRTLLVKVGNKQGALERAIGARLDSDETELKFWPVIRDGKRVGTVAAHLGKGDYGAIEVIMAFVDNGQGHPKLKGIKIQRDRERYRDELRSPTFLNQFLGKQAASGLQVGRDIRAADPQAIQASRVVALSVKKMLNAFELLDIGHK